MSRAQGTHGDGPRSYTPEQRRQVAELIGRLAPGQAFTVEALATATGISGRAIRDIVGDHDGIDYLLGGSDAKGYTRALDLADAERKTARMRSQVKAMSVRIARRETLARALFGSDLFGEGAA